MFWKPVPFHEISEPDSVTRPLEDRSKRKKKTKPLHLYTRNGDGSVTGGWYALMEPTREKIIGCIQPKTRSDVQKNGCVYCGRWWYPRHSRDCKLWAAGYLPGYTRERAKPCLSQWWRVINLKSWRLMIALRSGRPSCLFHFAERILNGRTF